MATGRARGCARRVGLSSFFLALSAHAACPDRSALLDEAVKKVAPDAERSPAGIDAAVRRARDELCEDESVERWLPRTCADVPPHDHEQLLLRNTLVHDVADLPRALLKEEKRADIRLTLLAMEVALYDNPSSATCAADETAEQKKERQDAVALASKSAPAIAFSRALAGGDLLGAAHVVAAAFGGHFATSVETGIERGIAIARANRPEEIVRLMNLRPLGLWSEQPWLFDSSVLALFPGDKTRLGGDVLFGYSGTHFGIATRGGIASYRLSHAGVSSDNDRWWIGLDAWGAFGTDKLKGEARLHFEGASLESSLGDPSAALSEETSTFFRTALLLGGRLEPNERLAAGVWLGPGFSYESYEPVRASTEVTADGTQPNIGLETIGNTSFLLEARVRLQYDIAPTWFGLRLTGDLFRHALTRDTLATVTLPSGTTSVVRAEDVDQVELRARLIADIEAAAFAGFVPGLTAGFDYFKRTGVDGAAAFLPIAGLALRRTSF